MDTPTLNLIRATNPWLVAKEQFPLVIQHRLPEKYIERVGAKFNVKSSRNKAQLFVGARQVGKSTALWSHFVENQTAPFYINGEEPLFQRWCDSPSIMLQELGELISPDVPIFIDEAQRLNEAGLFIKGLIDNGLQNPLFVTGSSSFHLRAQTRESLAGRVRRFQMHPFSLEELKNSFGDLPPMLLKDEVRIASERQMRYGGYPEVWMSKEPELIAGELVEAFVLRDASDLFLVDNLEAFRRVLKLIATDIGNLVNISEWASLCGVSRTTINRFLDILAETHIVRIVPPFAAGKRVEITSTPKIYFCDIGMRNAVLGYYNEIDDRADKGAVFENWVAAELIKLLEPLAPHQSLRFWRTKSGAEVDFIMERQNGLFAFEAKAGRLKRQVISKAQRSFIEVYQPKKLFVVNRSLEAEEQVGSTTVVWTTPHIFASPNRMWSDS